MGKSKGKKQEELEIFFDPNDENTVKLINTLENRGYKLTKKECKMQKPLFIVPGEKTMVGVEKINNYFNIV